jgi:hypothetical protein
MNCIELTVEEKALLGRINFAPASPEKHDPEYWNAVGDAAPRGWACQPRALVAGSRAAIGYRDGSHQVQFVSYAGSSHETASRSTVYHHQAAVDLGLAFIKHPLSNL